jgi:hypothetical protein
MPRELGYISTDDRVVIKSRGNETGFGGQDLTGHIGKRGTVLSEEGFGLCTVRLDDGGVVEAWNGADLDYEDTLPPIDE